eukprot:7477521-Alexandrium_andersonii.AAC.2
MRRRPQGLLVAHCTVRVKQQRFCVARAHPVPKHTALAVVRSQERVHDIEFVPRPCVGPTEDPTWCTVKRWRVSHYMCETTCTARFGRKQWCPECPRARRRIQHNHASGNRVPCGGLDT